MVTRTRTIAKCARRIHVYGRSSREHRSDASKYLIVRRFAGWLLGNLSGAGVCVCRFVTRPFVFQFLRVTAFSSATIISLLSALRLIKR